MSEVRREEIQDLIKDLQILSSAMVLQGQREKPQTLPNGNAMVSKLIWWILGIFASVLLLGTNAVITKAKDLDIKTHALAVEQSTLRQQVQQLEELSKMTRAEQVERTQKFGLIEGKQQLLEFRISNLIENFVLTNKRLDDLTKRP